MCLAAEAVAQLRRRVLGWARRACSMPAGDPRRRPRTHTHTRARAHTLGLGTQFTSAPAPAKRGPAALPQIFVHLVLAGIVCNVLHICAACAAFPSTAAAPTETCRLLVNNLGAHTGSGSPPDQRTSSVQASSWRLPCGGGTRAACRQCLFACRARKSRGSTHAVVSASFCCVLAIGCLVCGSLVLVLCFAAVASDAPGKTKR